MFREEYLTMCGSGIKKWDLLRSNPMAYLIASMVCLSPSAALSP